MCFNGKFGDSALISLRNCRRPITALRTELVHCHRNYAFAFCSSRDKAIVMARLARAVFPGVPHHVTQRGNGRATTFFRDGDYRLYRDLLAEHARACDVEVWSWVLMPNHVHLILVPPDEDALRRTLAPVHRYYAGHIHTRLQRSGHFWQGRFGCVAMDESHTSAALRYVALNPVRAGLVERASDWSWSSTKVLLGLAHDDGLTARDRALSLYPDYAERLAEGEDKDFSERLRNSESVGRPLGGQAFLNRLEHQSGRALKPARRGRPPTVKFGDSALNSFGEAC
jgi:putative transposase